MKQRCGNIDKELVRTADGAINPSGSDKCDYGNHLNAFFRDVAKLVSALDLGSSAVRREGSSPSIPTISN